MTKLLSRDVSMRFKARRGGDAVTALECISLEVADREFSVIVGPSR
jgi:ABC-type sugar transport system ATPase subunit